LNAPELNNKVRISLAAIISIVVLSCSVFGGYLSMVGLNEKVNAEVGGLRKDMDREIVLLKQEIELMRQQAAKEDVYIRQELGSVKEDGENRQEWLMRRADASVKTHEEIYHKAR